MTAIIIPSRRQRQPQYPVRVRKDGLGAGVLAAVLPSGARLYDAAIGELVPIVANSPDIVVAAGGWLARINAENEAWERSFNSQPAAMSLGWVGELLGSATDSGGLFGVTHSSDSGVSPYIANTLKRDSAGNLYYQFNTAGTYNYLSSALGTTGTKTLVGTYRSGAQGIYINGVLQGSSTYSGDIQFGSGARLFVGEDYRLSGRNGNAGLYLGVVWRKPLTQAEVKAFTEAPYGELFVKVPRVLYFEMAGGTNYTLPLDSGSFTLSGQASSLAHNKILSLAEGSFTLSGSSADLLSNKVLSLEQGSFNVSGQTADLLHNKLLSLENGSFTVTDSDATLLFNRLLELGVGSVTLSGSDATLTYTHGSTYSLVLSEGTFSLGGGSATLVHNKVIPLDSGVFTLSGSDINLIHGKNLTLEAGSFTLSGNDLTFLYNRALPLFSGSITISGGSSTLSYSGVPTISILESLKSYIETQRELKSKITIEIDLKSLL